VDILAIKGSTSQPKGPAPPRCGETRRVGHGSPCKDRKDKEKLKGLGHMARLKKDRTSHPYRKLHHQRGIHRQKKNRLLAVKKPASCAVGQKKGREKVQSIGVPGIVALEWTWKKMPRTTETHQRRKITVFVVRENR